MLSYFSRKYNVVGKHLIHFFLLLFFTKINKADNSQNQEQKFLMSSSAL